MFWHDPVCNFTQTFIFKHFLQQRTWCRIQYDTIYFDVPLGKFVFDSKAVHMTHDIRSHYISASIVIIIKNKQHKSKATCTEAHNNHILHILHNHGLFYKEFFFGARQGGFSSPKGKLPAWKWKELRTKTVTKMLSNCLNLSIYKVLTLYIVYQNRIN